MAPNKVTATLAKIQAEAQQRKQDATALAELFAAILPYFAVPDTRQWNIWLRRHDPGVIAESLERTAEWYENKSEMADKAIREGRPVPPEQAREFTLDTICRYASGVMKQKTAELNA